MENHQKLLGIRRDAIANAIHHTIDTFFNSDESFRRKNSSCLYAVGNNCTQLNWLHPAVLSVKNLSMSDMAHVV
jgi:pantothenate kinase